MIQDLIDSMNHIWNDTEEIFLLNNEIDPCSNSIDLEFVHHFMWILKEISKKQPWMTLKII